MFVKTFRMGACSAECGPPLDERVDAASRLGPDSGCPRIGEEDH